MNAILVQVLHEILNNRTIKQQAIFEEDPKSQKGEE